MSAPPPVDRGCLLAYFICFCLFSYLLFYISSVLLDAVIEDSAPQDTAKEIEIDEGKSTDEEK